MGVARTTAVAVVFPLGQKRAEHTVLHMKHRHVLVHRDIEPRARRAVEERFELRDIEVVTRRDALEAVVLEQVLGRERVGDVEREIATAAVGFEKCEMVVIAHEIAVGVGRTHLFQNPLLSGFEDAGRGDPDRRAARIDGRSGLGDGVQGALEFAEAGDGVTVVLRVLELTINCASTRQPSGVELFEEADDGDELGGALRCGGHRQS